MMTMMVISYIITWVSMIYSYVTAPSEEDLLRKKME